MYWKAGARGRHQRISAIELEAGGGAVLAAEAQAKASKRGDLFFSELCVPGITLGSYGWVVSGDFPSGVQFGTNSFQL